MKWQETFKKKQGNDSYWSKKNQSSSIPIILKTHPIHKFPRSTKRRTEKRSDKKHRLIHKETVLDCSNSPPKPPNFDKNTKMEREEAGRENGAKRERKRVDYPLIGGDSTVDRRELERSGCGNLRPGLGLDTRWLRSALGPSRLGRRYVNVITLGP